ncbi:MAG: eCIS core domain-containing protein [Kofleriaceae bacterium]
MTQARARTTVSTTPQARTPDAAPAAREVPAIADAGPAIDLSRIPIHPGTAPPRAGDVDGADGTLLVDGMPGHGQQTKAAFFASLRREIVAAAEQELAGTDWTAEHCPWLDYWFAYYEARSARDAEAALRRFAPATREATDAAGYLEPATARVREAIRHWRRTGEIDAPEAALPEPSRLAASLGPGRPLESSTRSRFEGAMGADLSEVRVHDDEPGARAAAAASARAFALGPHVAFASGEYRPGTLEGDALLAHELAHAQQQAGAIGAGAGGPALERDADRAATGILSRLWGALRGRAEPPPARPALRGGLALSRCRQHEGAKDYYTDTGPDGVYLRASPSLVQRDGEATAVVGQVVRFTPVSKIQNLRVGTPVWRAYLLLDEHGEKAKHQAKQNRYDTGFPVELDRAGLWLVIMEIRTRDHHFNLGTEVRVHSPTTLAEQGARTLEPLDYKQFRLNLAFRSLSDYGVEKDQSAAAPRDANKQPHSYIRSSAPSNPMQAQAWDANGIAFTIVPHPDAVTFKWHQYFDNPDKHPAKHFGGGSFHDLGTAKTQTIKLDRPDLYTIVCEQFDARGNELPPARYLQSVLLGDEWKASKRWLDYVSGVDKLVADLDPATRTQIPGVFVNIATGEAIPLAVYAGKSRANPGQHVVLDLMFGVGPKRFSGSKLGDALDDFQDNADEKYPAGRIYLKSSVVPGERDRPFETDGKTWLGELADYFGLGSIGLTVLGFASMLLGAEPLAWAFFAGAAAAGAGASGISLYQRFRRGEDDPLGYAIDILGLAANVLQGAAAFKAAVRTARSGTTAAELIVSSRGARFVAWTETGLVAASGVLISVESLLALAELGEGGGLSEGEKADRIASLLSQILLQGGIMALQAKNLGQVEAAFRARQVQLAELERRVLAQLEPSAIDGLKRIPDAEIPRIVAHVVDDPAGAAKALAKGTITSADALAAELHPRAPKPAAGAITPSAPVPEPATAKPPAPAPAPAPVPAPEPAPAPTPAKPFEPAPVPAPEPVPAKPPEPAPTPEPAPAKPPEPEPAPAAKKKKRPTFQQSKQTMSIAEIHSQELEDELVRRGFKDADLGALRRWGKAFARLKQNGSTMTAGALVGDLKPGYGRYAYDKLRYRLLDEVLDDILKPDSRAVPTRSPGDQAKRLRDYLSDMPDSASIGSLNSKYRAKRFAGPGDLQTIEGIKKSLDDPGKVASGPRDADGAMTVKNQRVVGGPPDGTYGIDDKAGKSFDLGQARDVSTLADSPQGLSMGGRKLDGYIYWCEDSGNADAVALKLKNARLSSKLRVTYLDPDGVVRWVR